MICTESATERCQLLKDSGFAKYTGVHLQSTLERHHKTPLSDPEEIPSLVDENGKFKHRDCEDPIAPDEIALEWERQIIKTMEALDGKPSHLDCHHGVHRKPHLTSVYFDLAQKYGFSVRGDETIIKIGQARNIKTTAFLEKEWTGQNEPLGFLQQKITDAFEKTPEGVVEIVAHPGFCDEDLIKSSPWNTVRENDHNVLIELAQSGWLKEQGIELVRHPDF